MSRPTTSMTISRITQYNIDDASMIGKLLTLLSKSASGYPVDKSLLESIIASPNHDQFVARNKNNEIVGIATVSIIMSIHKGKKAWLEDFVVSDNYRGFGVSTLLWNAVIDWCQGNDVASIEFTSNFKRQAAHAFYIKRGATIRDTAFFRKPL